MAIVYVPVLWQDYRTPEIDAENLNQMQQGIIDSVNAINVMQGQINLITGWQGITSIKDLELTERLSLLETGTGTKHTFIYAGNQTNDITYTLPASQGAAQSYLINDGNGNLTWQNFSLDQCLPLGGGTLTGPLILNGAPIEMSGEVGTVMGFNLHGSNQFGASTLNPNRDAVLQGGTAQMACGYYNDGVTDRFVSNKMAAMLKIGSAAQAGYLQYYLSTNTPQAGMPVQWSDPYTVWTGADMGQNSGMDADTLQGYRPSQFMKSNGINYNLPASQGGNGTSLVNNGAGTLSWQPVYAQIGTIISVNGEYAQVQTEGGQVVTARLVI